MKDRCIEGLSSLPAAIRGCVLTVGNFDGVHVGHQRILRTVRSLADADRLAAVAMTFEPPPDLVLCPEDEPRRITPLEEKQRLLLEAGADWVVVAASDIKLLGMTPSAFIEEILLRLLAPRHVVEGPNFFFGCRRSGTTETLSRAAAGRFTMHVVDPVTLDFPAGRAGVSSTLIRSFVEAGAIDEASRCLGREFCLFGRVVPGAGRGSKVLGFPTVNLQIQQQVVPGDGVYAGKAALAGQEFPAAISIGCNPTFGGEQRTVEAFLIGAKGDLQGSRMALRFVRRIGEQRRFKSAEALKAQIAKDVQRVREIIK